MMLLLLACTGAAPTPAAQSVVVTEPYVRAPGPGMDATAAYLTMRNTGATEQALVRAATPGVRAVELHGVFEENGLMSMRPVTTVPIAAGATVKLEPGGLHVMLLGVDHPLAAGDTVPLTLTFGDGTTLEFPAPVR